MKTPFTLWTGPRNSATVELFPNEIDFRLPDGMEITDNQAFTGAVKHREPWLSCSGSTWYFPWWDVIQHYDDSCGGLWYHANTFGIIGIARAQSEGDAYAIGEDEFFPEADETIEEIMAEYNFTRRRFRIYRDDSTGKEMEETPEDFPGGKLRPGLSLVRWDHEDIPCPEGAEPVFFDNPLFCEAYGFRNSGPNARDVHKHGIYSKDLNGEGFSELTPADRERMEISVYCRNQYSDYPFPRWSDYLEGRYQVS